MKKQQAIDTSKWTCCKCGCTDDRACAGGCYWVAPNLCSQCEPAEMVVPDDCLRMVTVRFPGDIYKKLRKASATVGLSMNAFCIQQIELAILRAERANGG